MLPRSTIAELDVNGGWPPIFHGSRRGAIVKLRGAGLGVFAVLFCFPVPAQEALRNSMTGVAAAEARRLQQENAAYTVKSGDLRLLANCALSLDWNDNVYLSKQNQQDDFILRPRVGLNASYPLTQRNLLQLNVTFGYDKYLNHNGLSTWYLQSGSELSFDVYIKEFLINLHDRFSYTQDSAQEAAVANTGSYGTFQNTAGVLGTWDLQDLTPSLGYDHQTYLSTSSQFDYTDHSTEMVVARTGLKVHPQATVGVEGTFSSTAYDQQVLNDNTGYSVGVFGEWRPGAYFSLQPRFGYIFCDFQQTSRVTSAEDVDGWYGDLTIRHDATKHLSYSLSAGHEVRLGLEADAIKDWYVRSSITWKMLERVSVLTGLFYEHGKQTGGNVPGFTEDNYDWYGGNIALTYSLLKNILIGLNYRLTMRSSNVASQEYTQNMVGIEVSYSPR
jgi:hypothetical protein